MIYHRPYREISLRRECSQTLSLAEEIIGTEGIERIIACALGIANEYYMGNIDWRKIAALPPASLGVRPPRPGCAGRFRIPFKPSAETFDALDALIWDDLSRAFPETRTPYRPFAVFLLLRLVILHHLGRVPLLLLTNPLPASTQESGESHAEQ